MNGQEMANAARQLGTLIFGMLTMRGYLTADQAETLVSNFAVVLPALATIASVGWSIYSHWNMKKVPEKSTAMQLPKSLGAPVIGESVNLTAASGVAKVVG